MKNILWYCKKCYKDAKKVLPMSKNYNVNEMMKDINTKMKKLTSQVGLLKLQQVEVRPSPITNEEELSCGLCEYSKLSTQGNHKLNLYSHVLQKKVRDGAGNLIVIKPKNNFEIKQDTMKTLKRSMNPTELKLGIKSMKQVGNGDLIIGCDTKKECEKLIEETRNKMGENYEVKKHVRAELCKILIIGVPKMSVKGGLKK